MSLINQMLHDLEQRNASAAETKPMSGEVRAVSAPKSLRSALLMIAALVVLLASVAAWMFLNKMPKPAVPVAVSAPPAQAKSVAVAPTHAPAVAELATAPAAAAATPEPASVQAPAQADAPHQSAEVVRRQPRLVHGPALVPVAPAIQPAASVPAEEVTMDAPLAPSMPAKPKAASRIFPGNAGASLKTVNPAQQSDNLYRQAVTTLQQGRVAEAQDMLHKALQANPGNLKARQALVGLLVEGKHLDEARALLLEGLQLAPEQSGFSMALARLQVEAGDARGGSETLEQGLKYAGDDADYHAFYAALMQREERHDAAVAHYLIALGSNPAMPSWLVGIGISWQAQGKLAEASEAYQRARDTGQLTPQLSQFVEQRLRQVKPSR